MDLVDDMEEDRRCAGVPGAPTCVKERGQLSPHCHECERELRIRRLEAKFETHTGTDKQNQARANGQRAAEVKKKKKQEKAAQPAQDPAAQEPPKIESSPIIVEQPIETPRLPEPRPTAKPIIKCSAPGCMNQAEDGELCKGCNGMYKIWHRYTMEHKPVPIILNAEVLARFQTIARQSDVG